jgi:hypothetical protein
MLPTLKNKPLSQVQGEGHCAKFWKWSYQMNLSKILSDLEVAKEDVVHK